MKDDDLIVAATAARGHARADYSDFKAGAAIRTADGKMYTGCNIENASYGLTVCAERVALLKALSEGASAFVEIAIVTDAGVVTPPCGACRQLLWEYCGDIVIFLHSTKGLDERWRLGDLLPHPFERRNLGK
jgi:cytidine deaminase